MEDKHKDLRWALDHYSVMDKSIPVNREEIRMLLAERDGLIAQHHRDSAELRSICAARDEARKQRDAMREALQSIAECCDEDHAARDYASRQTEIRGIARAALSK